MASRSRCCCTRQIKSKPPQVQTNDRPYGAWLFGSYELTRSKTRQRDTTPTEDTVALDLGVMGPAAGGRFVQDSIHHLFHIPSKVGQSYKKPLGWHHQLRNELGFHVRGLRRYQLFGNETDAGRHWDVLGHSGGSLGNITTWAQGGSTARLGFNVPNDFGPPAEITAPPPPQPAARATAPPAPQTAEGIRPDAPTMTAQRNRTPNARGPQPAPSTARRWSFYGFGAIEGRLVLRNAFLDGNLLATNRPDMGRVQKKPLVGDVDFGGVLQYRGVRITYHNIMRSSEFKTPLGAPSASVNNYAHRYGSLSVMFGQFSSD